MTTRWNDTRNLTLAESLAQRLPDHLLDLGEYAGDGIAGLSRYRSDLAAWVAQETGLTAAEYSRTTEGLRARKDDPAEQLVSEIMNIIGADDFARWYRVRLTRASRCLHNEAVTCACSDGG
ncbi:hypothetical protein [Mycobacterium sp. SMC-4]|uniref:hypothetical protein n=1 Tax=Mycobacterium sp. SMC-4 TaxID=2857059 RepID=UPI0021B2E653|nr:hypothetical protein [Mycobacterium sp. SMC-4]UXA17663.1 hypothetical protein KXD98_23645 [Mycobacterium sp. SMC-4]